MQRKFWGLMLWCGGTEMRMIGKFFLMLVLTDWLHCLKGELISGEDCSVFIMAGVLMAPVTVNLSLKLPRMGLR